MATVDATVLAETLDALIAVRECAGYGRIIFETTASEATIPAIEKAFFALGRAGGNVISSPQRASWERARNHLAAMRGTA